jgi:hypothetical protein
MTPDPVDESILKVRRSADDLYKETLRRKLAPRAMKDASGQYLEDLQRYMDEAQASDITHPALRRAERAGLSVGRGLSYVAKQVEESEARKLGVLRPAWKLDNKNSAYALLDSLGVRRPQSDTRTYRFGDVPRQSPCVIKATRSTGSRGCYLVFSESAIRYVRDGTTFDSWEAMEEHARGLMVKTNVRPLPDRWMVEELVLEDSENLVPGRDLKFYTFYGEVLFILEVQRIDGKAAYSYSLPDGTPMQAPGSWERVYYEGDGATAEQVRQVEAISREIPHPFMRIDMLKAENELVFGEFTPRNGDFHAVNEEWDRRMGEAWVRAESRLLEDMLRGKVFDAYLNATDLLADRKVDK